MAALMGVFRQYLSKKNTKLYIAIVKKEAAYATIFIVVYMAYTIEVCNGGYASLETSILELT